jgi:hypothetical protein
MNTDRLLGETERLRTAIRTGTLKRAAAICRRLCVHLDESVAESARQPRPRRSHARAVAPSSDGGSSPQNLVLLTDVAHEVGHDRRTVERRLTAAGCAIHRWKRIALVNHTAALAALQRDAP